MVRGFGGGCWSVALLWLTGGFARVASAKDSNTNSSCENAEEIIICRGKEKR